MAQGALCGQGAELVRLNRSSSDGVQAVEGCVYPGRRYYGVCRALMRRARALRSLSPPPRSSTTTSMNKLVGPRGGRGFRAWTRRTELPPNVLMLQRELSVKSTHDTKLERGGSVVSVSFIFADPP